MSDAAYGIVSENTDFTGNFLLDEDYLRTYQNISDFQSYQLDQSLTPHELKSKIEELRALQRKNSRVK